MKRRFFALLLVCLLLAGCSAQHKEKKIYDATFLDLFDTLTILRGYADSEEEFRATAQKIHDELMEYHQLFDIYQDYEGLNNLKTVNDQAGIAPVPVDSRIIDLLTDCREYYHLTGGRVNIAMGSVLKLWHDARSSGVNDPVHAALPDWAALEAASGHVDMDAVVIDAENSTVFIMDPNVRLDVGAVAKGWSAQRVSEKAPEGLLMSVGGNVCATGPKDDKGTPWVVGVNDPDGGDYLHTLYVTGGSVVTSGDYQRTYMVDGKFYHHIIDPDTLYPSTYWRSVTILCPDSGMADALSTALFLMPLEEGMALLEKCDAQAMWVDPEGENFYSPGFKTMIRT